MTVEIIDVSGIGTAPLRDEAPVPASDYVEATAAEGCTAVRYVDGALDAVLGGPVCGVDGARLAVQLASREAEAVATRTLDERAIEAQKEAEANVILRREETAATRSMAQTAKVLAENPLLVRLKDLEAYRELAGKVGQVNLVLGTGVLPQLQLKT